MHIVTYFVGSSITCTLQETLLGWSSQGGWDWRGM